MAEMIRERFLNVSPDLGVDDQVDVALTIARFLVLQAVELLGKRAQTLGHELERGDGYGELAATRAHHGAMHGDPVAHVQVFQLLEGIFAQGVDAAKELDGARMVHELEKGDLALRAFGHDAAGDGDLVFGVLTVLETSILLVKLLDRMRTCKGVAVRIAARIDERLALVTTNLYRIVDDLL